MIKPKTIMAACDGSPHAVEVFKYAAGLAQKCQAHLVLVHIIDERNVEAVQRAFGHLPHPEKAEWVNYLQDLMHDANAQLEELIHQHHDDRLSVVKVVEVGHVAARLLKLIAEKQVDLVVVGNTRYHLSYGHVFGGTLHRLFRLCSVPLISVRTGMAYESTHEVAPEKSGRAPKVGKRMVEDL